jgi:hypothetical protein
MPSRTWPAALAVLVTAVTGCTAEPATRATGDPVTRAEAEILAGLLHRNHGAGGAEFVITAPYGDGAVLTLTGEVDFRDGIGRAQAVTTFGADRPEDERTVVFTAEEIWTGGAPGLAEALAAAGEPAEYLRRDLTTAETPAGTTATDTTAAETTADAPLLADVLVTMLLGLSAGSPDEPASFSGPDHTWQGRRSIDSRSTTVFGLRDGRSVAVSDADDVLVQFATPLLDGGIVATVTLADHGPRTVRPPGDDVTAEAADHPELAEALGM